MRQIGFVVKDTEHAHCFPESADDRQKRRGLAFLKIHGRPGGDGRPPVANFCFGHRVCCRAKWLNDEIVPLTRKVAFRLTRRGRRTVKRDYEKAPGLFVELTKRDDIVVRCFLPAFWRSVAHAAELLSLRKGFERAPKTQKKRHERSDS